MQLNKILSAPFSLRQGGISRISLGRKKAKRRKERERKEERGLGAGGEREKKEKNEGPRGWREERKRMLAF